MGWVITHPIYKDMFCTFRYNCQQLKLVLEVPNSSAKALAKCQLDSRLIVYSLARLGQLKLARTWEKYNVAPCILMSMVSSYQEQKDEEQNMNEFRDSIVTALFNM